MSQIIVEKIPVSIEIIFEEYGHQIGAAISNDNAKTLAEKYLKIRLNIYNTYRMDDDPKLSICAIVTENAKEGYLALVADISKNDTIGFNLITSRIEEGLRDAQDLQEKIAATKALPEGTEKDAKIQSLNAMPPKLKKLAATLPDLRLAAIQIDSEEPGAINKEVMSQVEKISLKKADFRAEPNKEEIKFFVKVSSLANGNALVNVQNQEHGFEKLTISRFVDGVDYCDHFYHASLEKSVFEVTLLHDDELASASPKSILTAQKVHFQFSEKDVLGAVINRNKAGIEQIKLDLNLNE